MRHTGGCHHIVVVEHPENGGVIVGILLRPAGQGEDLSIGIGKGLKPVGIFLGNSQNIGRVFFVQVRCNIQEKTVLSAVLHQLRRGQPGADDNIRQRSVLEGLGKVFLFGAGVTVLQINIDAYGLLQKLKLPCFFGGKGAFGADDINGQGHGFVNQGKLACMEGIYKGGGGLRCGGGAISRVGAGGGNDTAGGQGKEQE